FTVCALDAIGVSASFFFQAEDGIRDFHVTGVQTCALPISSTSTITPSRRPRRSRPVTLASARSPCSTLRISYGGRNRSSPSPLRSEERRVGKEGRPRGAPHRQDARESERRPTHAPPARPPL